MQWNGLKQVQLHLAIKLLLMPGLSLTATKFGRPGMKPIPGGQNVQYGQMGQPVAKYKRVASGRGFSVDYPAALWNELPPEEQKRIAKFYNQTYGKTAASNGRPSGAINGRYPSSLR